MAHRLDSIPSLGAPPSDRTCRAVHRLVFGLALGLAGASHAVASDMLPTPESEQIALFELAEALQQRSDTDPVDLRATVVARSLAEGEVDSQTYEATVHMLLAVRDRPLNTEIEPMGVLALIVAMDPEARAMNRSTPSYLASGRAALRAGEYSTAVDLLYPVRQQPAVLPFWREAVDGHVYAERERAGQIYQRSRAMDGRERVRRMLEARAILAGLVEAYPDTVYLEPLVRALARVERDLQSLVPTR